MIVPLARKLRTPLALALVAGAFLATQSQAASAQAAATERLHPDSASVSNSAPAFDVVAIHLHKPEPHEHNSIWSSPFDGQFKAENMSVVMLIHWAYEMPETRILDAPGWAASTFLNIDARTDPAADQQLHSLSSDAGRKLKENMVQALLQDRFKLATHAEERTLPIYILVPAKRGARMDEVKTGGTMINYGRDHLEVQGTNSMSLLAEVLSQELGRPVVDKTGIVGRYHLALKWTPDDAPGPLVGAAEPDSAPSIFTALEEQLGLKLEPQKGPVPVLVIDHVELPSEN